MGPQKRQEIYVENSLSRNVSKTGDYVTPGLSGRYKGQEVRDYSWNSNELRCEQGTSVINTFSHVLSNKQWQLGLRLVTQNIWYIVEGVLFVNPIISSQIITCFVFRSWLTLIITVWQPTSIWKITACLGIFSLVTGFISLKTWREMSRW